MNNKSLPPFVSPLYSKQVKSIMRMFFFAFVITQLSKLILLITYFPLDERLHEKGLLAWFFQYLIPDLGWFFSLNFLWIFLFLLPLQIPLLFQKLAKWIFLAWNFGALGIYFSRHLWNFPFATQYPSIDYNPAGSMGLISIIIFLLYGFWTYKHQILWWNQSKGSTKKAWTAFGILFLLIVAFVVITRENNFPAPIPSFLSVYPF